MLWLFQKLTDRLKALFVTDVALDFEAQLLARDAERKADLLRKAAGYEDEGFTGIAQQLRNQAAALSLHSPLVGVLPAIEHLQGNPPDMPTAPLLFAPSADSSTTENAANRSPTVAHSRKKGK